MWLHLVRLALPFVLLTGSATAGEKYAVLQWGATSCANWTAARYDQQAFDYQQWVAGFLSGVGFAGRSIGMNPLMDPGKTLDADAIWGWVDNYCQAHPLDQIRNASEAFVAAHPHGSPDQSRSLKVDSALNFVGLMLGVVSTFLLFLGSKAFPNPSWTKERLDEKRFSNRRLLYIRSGFVLLFVSFLLQTAAEVSASGLSLIINILRRN